MRRPILALAVLLVVALALLRLVGTRIEPSLNRVEPVDLSPPSPRARALHADAVVVDLHADSLLFGRDLLRRSRVGHVDLPRLQQGNVALQVFTAATVTPLGLNMERNDGDALDLLTLAGIARFSRTAWLSPMGRALHQKRHLDGLVERSAGALQTLTSRAELEALLAARAAAGPEPRPVGALFGLEGAHGLDDDLANLDALADAGVRMIGLAHFFDNAFAGSAHGLEKGPLTALGRQLVTEMERRGILVDVSHLSPTATVELLDLATRPVVSSHGGVRGTCASPRNLSDDLVRRIAAGGGVVGIGYWETAVCGTGPEHFAAAVRHVVDLVGDDHVGLGSDFDGATTMGFDAGGLVHLTQALLDAGLSEESVRKVLGGNVLRVLRQVLPPR